MTTLNAASTVALKHSSKRMPVLALGVYQSTAAFDSATLALKYGYTHIDSARVYRNETEVAKAFLSSGLKREEVWLTTKIQGREHATDKAIEAVKTSTERAGLAAPWDLILLHDPTSGPEKRMQAWKVLLEAKQQGKVNAIGVSNFGVKHLKEFEAVGGIEVNQVELHPWCQQRDIVEYCRQNAIVVQAYSPLAQAKRLSDPTLVAVAERSGRTPAQVLIRWSLQKGFVPLPKSDREARIRENLDVFGWELDSEAMTRLDELDQGSAGAVTWNVVNVP